MTKMLRIAALTAASLLALPALALNVGDPAPATRGPQLLGAGDTGLDALAGKLVLLDFWASWCGPCLVSLPQIEAMRARLIERGYGDRFEVLAINLDTDPEKGRRFLKARPVSYPVISDPKGALPRAYAVPTMPTTYLISPDGTVLFVHEGYHDGDAAILENNIVKTLELLK